MAIWLVRRYNVFVQLSLRGRGVFKMRMVVGYDAVFTFHDGVNVLWLILVYYHQMSYRNIS